MRYWLLLPLLVCLLAVRLPVSADESPATADLLADLEQFCLGESETRNSLNDRMAVLENLIWGHPGQGTLPERAAALREIFFTGAPRSVSLIFRLNAIEWELYHQIAERPLLTRVRDLEMVILGREGTGPLPARLEAISAYVWPGGRLPTARIDITAGTLVKIKLLADISSAVNVTGDVFPFVISQTVIQDGFVALPQGSTGEGRVARIDPPRNMGRDARITLNFGPIRALDGTSVRVDAGEASIAANKSQRLTVRVTTAGLIVLGPAGILSSLFVHGRETVLPKGTELFVQTTAVTSCLTLAKGEY